MVIFIDESGIHKQTGHSTASVVYVRVKNLEKFEDGIKKIEKDLNISSFHWAEERWLMKNKFLSRIFELDFTVYENKLKKVLKDKGIAIKKLRTVRSKSEVGIQLADALASLIRYYHDNQIGRASC